MENKLKSNTIINEVHFVLKLKINQENHNTPGHKAIKVLSGITGYYFTFVITFIKFICNQKNDCIEINYIDIQSKNKIK